MVIFNMRQKKPDYNIITNNCQNFASLLLDAIQTGAHQQFATAFAVYQRMTGAGHIKDLFVEDEVDQTVAEQELHRQNTLQTAQQVMDEQTTTLDSHHTLH